MHNNKQAAAAASEYKLPEIRRYCTGEANKLIMHKRITKKKLAIIIIIIIIMEPAKRNEPIIRVRNSAPITLLMNRQTI